MFDYDERPAEGVTLVNQDEEDTSRGSKPAP
jgi:hypothetical protein